MSLNLDLKVALIRRFGTQAEAARQLGIREAKLSYMVQGHTEPSKTEREALERALGKVAVRRLIKKGTVKQ